MDGYALSEYVGTGLSRFLLGEATLYIPEAGVMINKTWPRQVEALSSAKFENIKRNRSITKALLDDAKVRSIVEARESVSSGIALDIAVEELYQQPPMKVYHCRRTLHWVKEVPEGQLTYVRSKDALSGLYELGVILERGGDLDRDFGAPLNKLIKHALNEEEWKEWKEKYLADQLKYDLEEALAILKSERHYQFIAP